MMSAETLKAAAALMQERAYGATSGPWTVSSDSDGASRRSVYSEFIATRYAEADPVVAEVRSPQYGDTDETKWGQTSDAEHIASWPPEVADEVSAWLGEVADGWTDDPGCDLGGGMDGPPCGECFKCAYRENQYRALAVANAYLGTSTDRTDR